MELSESSALSSGLNFCANKMGSESRKLPVIDFCNLKHDTATRIREALEEYGCFEATFDSIPLHLRESLLLGIQQLFDLPLQTKLSNRVNNPFHGYVGQVPVVPLYESLGIEDVLSPGKVDTFTKGMWPQGNPSFSKSVQMYCELLSELDKSVRRMVLESLGLEKYMKDHMNSTKYVVRVQKYEGPGSNATELGLIPHTDKNIITLLHQLNGVKGLQIATKDGKNWISVEPGSPTSFIVFVGASLRAWTNGRLHSPVHRVIINGDEARYSVGLFSSPKEGVIIKAAEEMVNEEHPLLFKPFEYYKFLEFLHSGADQTSADTLKDYCGA